MSTSERLIKVTKTSTDPVDGCEAGDVCAWIGDSRYIMDQSDLDAATVPLDTIEKAAKWDAAKQLIGLAYSISTAIRASARPHDAGVMELADKIAEIARRDYPTAPQEPSEKMDEANATPSPWSVDGAGLIQGMEKDRPCVFIWGPDGEGSGAVAQVYGEETGGDAVANAELIVRLRNQQPSCAGAEKSATVGTATPNSAQPPPGSPSPAEPTVKPQVMWYDKATGQPLFGPAPDSPSRPSAEVPTNLSEAKIGPESNTAEQERKLSDDALRAARKGGR